MSRDNLLAQFADQVGFTVESEAGVLRAVGVPCLLNGGIKGTCILETSFDSTSGEPTSQVGGAVHGAKVSTSQHLDGCVYEADGSPIGNNIDGDGQSWSCISIKRGVQGSPQADRSASDLLHRYAKRIVGAASSAGHSVPVSPSAPSPFNIPNTFEARAGMASIQDRVRGQSVAIIGLGGTGSYILDQVAKTPVSNIHLLDSDKVDWHTLFRAPGAPTAEEIESVRNGTMLKVDYYRSKYAPLRKYIQAHPVQVDSTSMWRDFLSAYPIDYAFVCIDQETDTDSPRRDAVYLALSETQVPFVDSGVNISVESGTVAGSVTTSAYEAGSTAWETAVPNARVAGEHPGYRNSQLPEVNAMAASLAVMEWRRRTGQYSSESTSLLHKFKLAKPNVVHIQSGGAG